MKALINARVIVPDYRGDFEIREGHGILYEEKIRRVFPMSEWRGDADEVMDAGGHYIAPGFINVHIHGCGGKDTMDEDEDAIPVMQKFQAAMGVTGFLPTTMTYDLPRIHRALVRIRAAMGAFQADGARVLGCHMEGPYISAAHRGAQAAEHIRVADYADFEGFEDVLKIITVAPEELPDREFARRCRQEGIILSIGHTSADYEQAMDAVEHQGIRRFTHLFNAMTGFHHRAPGAVGAALDTDATCELIADNVHTCPAAQRLVYHAKGGRNIILVTDSLRACGMGDGISELGGQRVWVRGELATLEDGTIAASVLSMNRAIAIFRENTGAPLSRVVEMATRIPAEELGIYGQVGSIESGKRADLVVFDDDIGIRETIVGGETVCRPASI